VTDFNAEVFNKILTQLPGPHAFWAFGVLMLISMVYRLFAEWQRRVTLDHIFKNAPGGSVVIQEKGLACPAMSVWVGTGPYPPPTVVHVVVHPPGRQWHLPAGDGR
jgi:hypothetical protein